MPLYLTSFLAIGLALSVLGPALTELRERTDTGIGAIGTLFVGQSAGYLLGSVLAGRLYDRFDGHRVFAGALTLLGVGLATVSTMHSMAGLLLAFFAVGAGAGGADVGANALLMWRLGPAVGPTMNLLHLCFGIGALTTPLFVHLGLGIATISGAVACGIFAVWALRVPAPTPHTAPAREEHSPSRLLAVLAAFFFLYVGLEVGFAGWVNTYGEEVGFSELAAKWVTTVFWIGFTLGRVLSSAVSTRVRPKVVLVVASVATLVASLLLLVGDGRPAVVWAGSFAMGLATAPQFPVMLTYLERRIRVTGSATAWFVGAAGLGALVFPWLIGRWFEASGAAALPAAMVALAILTAGSFAYTNHRLGG